MSADKVNVLSSVFVVASAKFVLNRSRYNLHLLPLLLNPVAISALTDEIPPMYVHLSVRANCINPSPTFVNRILSIACSPSCTIPPCHPSPAPKRIAFRLSGLWCGKLFVFAKYKAVNSCHIVLVFYVTCFPSSSSSVILERLFD